jgi:hypothetical protein
VSLTPSANPSKYGQEVRVTAHATTPEATGNVGSGSIQFTVDGVEQGPPVHLDGNGLATSPPLVDEGGVPLEVTIASDFHAVNADFVPDPGSDFDTGSGPEATYQQRVDPAGSTMAIQPSATAIVVDLSGALPGGAQTGSARPTGTVHVVASGQDLGNVPIDPNTGRATVNHALPPGQPQSVSATYAGDSRYGTSSASTVRRDPRLEARIISLFPRSKAGWYRTPVEIWFRCTPMGSELVADCPSDATLKDNGKHQSLTRTITAVDGGSASVTVSGIDIDRDRPVITIVGHSCTATDDLSGVKGRCHMQIAANGAYRAIAHDRAGNRAVKKGFLD